MRNGRPGLDNALVDQLREYMRGFRGRCSRSGVNEVPLVETEEGEDEWKSSWAGCGERMTRRTIGFRPCPSRDLEGPPAVPFVAVLEILEYSWLHERPSPNHYGIDT